MSALPQADLDVIDMLARHYRCPLSEKAEMRHLAETDPDAMASYRRIANEIARPRQNRSSPAYLQAMEKLAQIGIKRRTPA